MKIQYEELCQKVIKIVRETGLFIQKEAQSFSPEKIEIKGKHDLVSYVDKQAEEMLVKTLASLLPEAGFITEEKTINKTGAIYNWIIDPLDGTTNFIHGLPVYSISIALQENDHLVIGVVLELNRDELFYAWKDSQAYMNGIPIHVSNYKTLNESLIATGFPYSLFNEIDSYLNLLKAMMQESQGIRRLGSAAIDLCYVACARFEGYFEFNINSYDVAGGMFILQQAGGQFSTFKTGDSQIESIFKSRQILATNAHIHEQMLDIIKTEFLDTL